jgi:hypothetical protein
VDAVRPSGENRTPQKFPTTPVGGEGDNTEMSEQETAAAPITTEHNDGTVTVELYEAMRGGDVDDYHADVDRFLERIPRIAVQMVCGCRNSELDLDEPDPDAYQAFNFSLNPTRLCGSRTGSSKSPGR